MAKVNLIREILEPPLRERERVEKALAAAKPKDHLRLCALLDYGHVRGDWRRVLVRKRIEQLLKGEASAISAPLR